MIGSGRGDIGFMEAMVSAMAVCLVLTCFIAFFAAYAAESGTAHPEFDWNAVSSVRLEDGAYDGPGVEASATEQMSLHGWRGVLLTCSGNGSGEPSAQWAVGSDGGDSVRDRIMRPVPSDDGRLVPTVFEVTVWF